MMQAFYRFLLYCDFAVGYKKEVTDWVRFYKSAAYGFVNETDMQKYAIDFWWLHPQHSPHLELCICV